MLVDKLNPIYFFLAFAVGLFYCYITTPSPNIVLKFPSPINAGTVTYKDKDDNCFKYIATQEACDKRDIKPQPLSLEEFRFF